MVECTMFYVLIFSLAAVILVIAFVITVTRRRRTLGAEEAHVSSGDGHSVHTAHGTHPDAAERRNRKAMRSQSRHDRRKRH
jgi:hypothetical protein